MTSRFNGIGVCLIGLEQHNARPDLTDDSGFWLRVKADDGSPFIAAFKDSPAVFHEFRIEQRVGKEIRTSTLSAQIVKIEEGPTDTRILIRPCVLAKYLECCSVDYALAVTRKCQCKPSPTFRQNFGDQASRRRQCFPKRNESPR